MLLEFNKTDLQELLHFTRFVGLLNRKEADFTSEAQAEAKKYAQRYRVGSLAEAKHLIEVARGELKAEREQQRLEATDQDEFEKNREDLATERDDYETRQQAREYAKQRNAKKHPRTFTGDPSVRDSVLKWIEKQRRRRSSN